MKIAYLLPNLSVSGGVAVVFQHANRLARRGYEVCVLTLCGLEPTDWFPGQQIRCFTLDKCPADLDVVFATSWETAFYVPNIPARHKCYFVQSDETRFHPENSLPYYFAGLSYAMDFHFVTEARWIQTFLSSNYGKLADYVPNGLDESIFFRTAPLHPKSGRCRVLLEGAIDIPYKGMAEAFAAVAPLDVEVWCVSSYGKPKRGWRCDRFFEKVPMHKMRHIYSSCDILLKLSRVEGFFGPPLEMMACGGCCVVAQVSGADEYIVNGHNAIVVKNPYDIDEARAAVARLMADAGLRQQIIENGYRTAAAWNWEKSLDCLEAFLQNLDDVSRTNSISRINADISNFYFSYKNSSIQGGTKNFDLAPHDKIFGRLSNYAMVRNMCAWSYYLYKRIKTL